MLMKSTVLAALVCLPVVLTAGPAMADPWKNESGKGRYHRGPDHKEEREYGRHGYKYEWQDGDCKYEYKSGRHGYKEERKCGGGRHHAGGPPPWAPAHGYRRHRGGYRDDAPVAYVPPFDIDLGSCNREMLGSLLGAAVGGAAGSQIGDGRGQLAAVAGGTLLGYLIGGSIGRSMDELDQHCIGQVLEHASDGQDIVWQNPDNGTQYQVVPTQTVQQSDGRYCREYTTTAVINGREQQTYGRACRQPDGDWQIVRN